MTNWFDKDYNNFYISIDMCNQLTYEKQCKSTAEIEEFLTENLFYVIRQTTKPGKNIFSENADPKFKTDDPNNYWPLVIGMDSVMFDTIENTSKNVRILELMYGLDNIKIDNSWFQLGLSEQDKDYINVQNYRYIKDKRDAFVDQQIKNHPLLVVMFGIQKDGVSYERVFYDFFECLSFIGGIMEIVNTTLGMISFILCINIIDSKTVATFYQETFENNSQDIHGSIQCT